MRWPRPSKALPGVKPINPCGSSSRRPRRPRRPGSWPSCPLIGSGSQPAFGLKAIGIFPGNADRQMDPHQGAVALFDGETGELRALMNGTAVTAIRTAAVSALATRLLAREARSPCSSRSDSQSKTWRRRRSSSNVRPLPASAPGWNSGPAPRGRRGSVGSDGTMPRDHTPIRPEARRCENDLMRANRQGLRLPKPSTTPPERRRSEEERIRVQPVAAGGWSRLVIDSRQARRLHQPLVPRRGGTAPSRRQTPMQRLH
jgi:hypothetical protein